MRAKRKYGPLHSANGRHRCGFGRVSRTGPVGVAGSIIEGQRSSYTAHVEKFL